MSTRNQWRHRVRLLFSKDRVEREMRDEMAFHLEMETAELIEQGHPEEEARQLARQRFGGVQQHQEDARDSRGMRWADDLVQDSRFTLRGLRRALHASSRQRIEPSIRFAISCASTCRRSALRIISAALGPPV